jgi:hypothetical protein
MENKLFYYFIINRAARTGPPERDRQKWTGRIEQAELD